MKPFEIITIFLTGGSLLSLFFYKSNFEVDIFETYKFKFNN